MYIVQDKLKKKISDFKYYDERCGNLSQNRSYYLLFTFVQKMFFVKSIIWKNNLCCTQATIFDETSNEKFNPLGYSKWGLNWAANILFLLQTLQSDSNLAKGKQSTCWTSLNEKRLLYPK